MNLNPLLKSVTLYFALTLNQPPTLIKPQPFSPGSTPPMLDMILSNAVAKLFTVGTTVGTDVIGNNGERRIPLGRGHLEVLVGGGGTSGGRSGCVNQAVSVGV